MRRSVARGRVTPGRFSGCLAALLIGFLADRFLRASPAERLLIAPVAGTSAIAIGLAALGFAASASIGLAASPSRRALTVAVAVALIGVAVAVSWEIVRGAPPAADRLAWSRISRVHPARGAFATSSPRSRTTNRSRSRFRSPIAWSMRPDAQSRIRAHPARIGCGVPPSRSGRTAPHSPCSPTAPACSMIDGFRDAVARAASLALEHERLQAELASRVSDLQGSRARLVTSFDSERRRLERDLHDGAQQQVVALLLKLRLALARHPDPELVWAIAEVGAALDELRELAHGLYPAALAEDGLGGGAGCASRRAPTSPSGSVGAPGRRWSSAVETTAYVVVVETLRARRLRSAVVEVTESDGVLSVSVSGAPDGPEAFAGFGDGVGGLNDRVGAIGGDLRVDVIAGASTVRAELPCGS